MTFLSLHPFSFPRERLQPKLTVPGLYMVAFLRNGETGRNINSIEGSVIPLGSDWLRSQKSPIYDLCHPSIVKQPTSFSS